MGTKTVIGYFCLWMLSGISLSVKISAVKISVETSFNFIPEGIMTSTLQLYFLGATQQLEVLDYATGSQQQHIFWPEL